MDLEKILKALNIGESSDWEFKSAKGGFPDIWPSYSGMSNTNGGTVVLGIKESNGRFSIDGLAFDQVSSFQKILWDNLNNPSKVSRNILAPHHVNVLKIGEKTLLSIEIPRASRAESPIYIGPTPLGNTYRRCHEGNYRCTDDQVRRMLADSSPISPDIRILRGFTVDDLDTLSLEQYRNRFLSAKPGHPWHSLPLHQFLERLNGWRKDKESGEEGLTLAALLMFGRHRSILESGGAPEYFVDYREKLNPDLRWNHRIYPDGTWEPNLFQFYQRIWPHLTADLKVPFHLEGMQRIDETPVHQALREALVNALIHSDYAAPGGVIIERFRDLFVLDNPGTLLVSIDQLRRGGISQCRNKTLQTMFMMIGGGERAGSGVNRIQSEWKNQHWRVPSYIIQDHPDRVRLILPMVSLIPDAALSSLQSRLGARFGTLKNSEVVALATADIEGEVSNARLQELVPDHPAEITQILQGLCSEGLLVSDNRRRWTRYHIPNSPHLPINSPHLPINSPHLPADSPHLPINSPHLSDPVLEKLAASIAQSKRVPKTKMREIILQLCSVKYLSLSDLSRLLNRSPKSLQNHYLTTLIAEGFLELQYRDTPNRPDQAYITRKTDHSL